MVSNEDREIPREGRLATPMKSPRLAREKRRRHCPIGTNPIERRCEKSVMSSSSNAGPAKILERLNEPRC